MAATGTSPVLPPGNGAAGAALSHTFGADVLASIVVFLVALPLCMGIAIASNMPPAAGLVSGIIGGLVVGMLAGSPLQVSGPAAGLAVLVWQLVEKHGVELLGIIVLIAGVIQLVAGALKVGQWFRAVSPAVVHGMLAGIGTLIFASQFHVMLDFRPIGSGIENLAGIPYSIYEALTLRDFHLTAGEIGLLTIIVIFGWNSFAPKSLKGVPAPLVGVAVAMIAAAVFKLDDIKHVQIDPNILASLSLPSLETFKHVTDPAILVGAFSIAFIASAETLLCATAVDQMHSGPRTRYDQELRAQGIGNAICGALGALPMTGVIVRSGANVEAGAKTRTSAILHGVWLLLIVAVLPWVLAYIPLSALAAVLVYTGYKLAYPKIVPTLRQYGWSEVFIYAATIVTIVLTDLLTGVVTGIALSIAKLLYTFSHLEIRREDNAAENRIDLHVVGAATVVRLPLLASALEQLPPGGHVHIHVGDLDYIDHACIDLLRTWEKQHQATGGTLDIEWATLEHRYRSKSAAGNQAVRTPTETSPNAGT
ncbi:MAG: SulP family inorganic anion transporter [Hyphomicrobium sp.]|nr:SulP family inorganic anion transporter [Hyphomicrobium sp.]